MKVYVESNFVLELALVQEEADSCEELLRLCNAKYLNLRIPAYSLAEPYETLVRRRKRRLQIKRDLDTEMRQLARTSTYADRLDGLDQSTALLMASVDQDASSLQTVLARITAVANVMPLGSAILKASSEYQRTHDFSPQDAIVYAAVVADLDAGEPDGQSCFLNRNSKDFDDQPVVEELERYRCKLLPRFESGLHYVRSKLGSAESGQ